nr:transcription factor GATA-6-like [Cavia porcellus]
MPGRGARSPRGREPVSPCEPVFGAWAPAAPEAAAVKPSAGGGARGGRADGPGAPGRARADPAGSPPRGRPGAWRAPGGRQPEGQSRGGQTRWRPDPLSGRQGGGPAFASEADLTAGLHVPDQWTHTHHTVPGHGCSMTCPGCCIEVLPASSPKKIDLFKIQL